MHDIPNRSTTTFHPDEFPMASEVSNTFLPPGPPAYVANLTAREIMDRIYARGLAIGNPLRAWWILGYVNHDGPDEWGHWNFFDIDYTHQDPSKKHQPTQDRFERDISALWTFLVESDEGKTPFGREVLARILESLRALGYRRRGWGLDSAVLFTDSEETFERVGVKWKDLPEPDGPVPSMRNSALEELARPPEKPLLSPNPPMLLDDMLDEWMLWTKYYAYQGFAVDDGQKEREFRAIPVPEEHSLWHSLSYHLSPTTNTGFPNIMHHYEIKACIWAYFTQVLEHPKHIRWREYIYLNYYADPEQDKPNPYGSSSILRHLHCNERIHHALTPALWTSPVFRTPPDILHIVADYYDVQIVLFTYPASAGYIDPIQEHSAYRHTVQIFGDLAKPQIFLYTTHLTPGIYSPAIPIAPKDAAQTPTDAQPFVPNPEITTYPSMSPWRASQPNYRPTPLPIPPKVIPHFALPDVHFGPPTVVDSKADLWVPTSGTKLTQHVVDLFRHGLDIPGRALKGLPSRETVESWDGPVEPLQYDVRRRARKQIRYGGLTKVVEGVSPQDEVDYESVFFYWAWQFKKEGRREYLGY